MLLGITVSLCAALLGRVEAGLAQSSPPVTVDPAAANLVLTQGSAISTTLLLHNLNATPQDFTATTLDLQGPWQPLTFPETTIDPALGATLHIAGDAPIQFVVYLHQQADLAPAFAISNWHERGRYVVRTLRATAQQHQQKLLTYLAEQVATGSVTSYHALFIANAVVVTGTFGALDGIAAQSDVAYIEAVEVATLPDTWISTDAAPLALDWGLVQIGADRTWAGFGAQGQGVVVGAIDTGVLWNHPALVSQYRGGVIGNHDYNWFDATGASPTAPSDNHGHGTHTLGILAAVAPQAQWIAARGCTATSCAETDLIEAAEWMLAPYPHGQTPGAGDPDRRPRIINASWGGPGGNLWYEAIVNAWRAADILPVFAAGNKGPAAGTILSPADYEGSLAVGATDSNDLVASFSGRGPSTLSTTLKPDLVAPGVNIRSTWNDGGYRLLSGTSMASPHSAGCAALLWSLAPHLRVEQMHALLTTSALDIATSGPDSAAGHGRLDCYAAAERVTAVPWLRILPTHGTLAAHGHQPLQLLIDASTLSPGLYSAQLHLTFTNTTDLRLTVPVTLTVLESVYTHTLHVVPGDNLLSLPLQPTDSAIGATLSQTAAAANALFAYVGCDPQDPWKQHDPAAPAYANDLTHLEAGMGFWLSAPTTATLTLTGTLATSSVELCPGWNLAGYPAPTPQPLAQAVASLEGCLAAIYGYDPTDAADPWKQYDPAAPSYANDLLEVRPGQGYWLRVEHACVWTVGP